MTVVDGGEWGRRFIAGKSDRYTYEYYNDYTRYVMCTGQGSMTRFCENCNEHPGSIKYEYLID